MYQFSLPNEMILKRIIWFLSETTNFIYQFFWDAIRTNDSKIAFIIRKKLYGGACIVDTNVVIKNKYNFIAKSGSCLYHSCYILNYNGKFVLGNSSHLAALCYVNVCYGNVIIGDNVAIGPGTKIIAYSNNYQFGKKVTDERIISDIIIGNNVFVGANCTILPGSIINDNVIVGAGSVVKSKLESNSIYAGVPCKKIKTGWYE